MANTYLKSSREVIIFVGIRKTIIRNTNNKHKIFITVFSLKKIMHTLAVLHIISIFIFELVYKNKKR